LDDVVVASDLEVIDVPGKVQAVGLPNILFPSILVAQSVVRAFHGISIMNTTVHQ